MKHQIYYLSSMESFRHDVYARVAYSNLAFISARWSLTRGYFLVCWRRPVADSEWRCRD